MLAVLLLKKIQVALSPILQVRFQHDHNCLYDQNWNMSEPDRLARHQVLRTLQSLFPFTDQTQAERSAHLSHFP